MPPVSPQISEACGHFPLVIVERAGPGPSSFVGVATPVVAMLVSTALEGYRWTWVGGVGVALAAIGNAIALRPAASGARR